MNLRHILSVDAFIGFLDQNVGFPPLLWVIGISRSVGFFEPFRIMYTYTTVTNSVSSGAMPGVIKKPVRSLIAVEFKLPTFC